MPVVTVRVPKQALARSMRTPAPTSAALLLLLLLSTFQARSIYIFRGDSASERR
jgi:hypothetical protein